MLRGAKLVLLGRLREARVIRKINKVCFYIIIW